MKNLLAVFICMVALLSACTKNEGKTADNAESGMVVPATQENLNTDPDTPPVHENRDTDPDNIASPQEAQTGLNKPMFVNATAGLRVRDTPGLDGNRLGSLDFGTIVTPVKEEGEAVNIDGVEGKWVYLESPVAGWVFDGYLGEVITRDSLGSVPRGAITKFDQKPEYPIYAEEESQPYLIFSDNTKVNVGMRHHGMENLRNIVIYAMPNKESESKMVDSLGYAAVFRMPETEDWLYLMDFGFIYVYDLPGSEDQLENELFRKFPIFRRYGPLLEINYNGETIKIWNSGNEVGIHVFELRDYYEEYGEMLIYQGFYESGGYSIYNLQNESFTDYSGDIPHFNNARDAVATLWLGKGEPAVEMYTIDNGVYTIVFAEQTSVYDPEKMYWVNNDEFRLKASDGSTLVIRRNGTDFELADK